MQYVAPSIILMAGLGAAVLLARLPRPNWRDRAPALVFSHPGVRRDRDDGLGCVAPVHEPTRPGRSRFARGSGRRSRPEPSRSAPGRISTCRSTRWSGKATARRSTCAIRPSIRPGIAGRRPRGSTGSSASHPLRIVVFGETRGDAAVVARWIRENAGRYTLRSRRERVLNEGFRRGKALAEDRYVVYELVPAGS